MALSGFSAASSTSNCWDSSEFRRLPGSRASGWPKTHWLGEYPFGLGKAFRVWVTMLVAVKASAMVVTWTSMQTLFQTSFYSPPARSHRPFCQGDSRGMTSCSTPYSFKKSENCAMYSLPRSTWRDLGSPAQDDQEVRKWRSTTPDDGGPVSSQGKTPPERK